MVHKIGLTNPDTHGPDRFYNLDVGGKKKDTNKHKQGEFDEDPVWVVSHNIKDMVQIYWENPLVLQWL